MKYRKYSNLVVSDCWHRLESLSHGTVIVECKDGAFVPIEAEDIMALA